jgi:hypothetical protein
MPNYSVHIVAKKACGCTAHIDFNLNDGEVPSQYDVGAMLYTALDPDETDLLQFLTDVDRCAPHGAEKVTVTAELKVR